MTVIGTDFSGFDPLRMVSDQQLRAECSRRGIGHVSEPMCTVAERDRLRADYVGACQLVAQMHAAAIGGKVGDGPRLGVLEDVVALAKERDALHAEVCRLTEHAHGPSGPDGCERCRFERERDEWKRRAEAAEGVLADVPRRNADDAMKRRRNPSLVAKREAAWKRTYTERTERGPGIDPRPDNSVAWLDEDLLCEDE